jgi:hypothetical protein
MTVARSLLVRAAGGAALLLLVQLTLVAAAANAGPHTWSVEIIDTYHVGKFSSLAIDSSDHPHVSYYDESTGDLKYATKTASGWVPEVVAPAGKPNAGSFAIYTSIAVDAAGAPRIIYYDDNTHQLKYAVKTAGSWAIETVDAGCGPCALNGFFPSLALDSSGNPHVSYYGNPGGTANGYLKYAVKSGGTWNTEMVDNDGDSGNGTSIAIDGSGNPHIAYLRYPSLLSHSDNTLKYATKQGGTWTIDEVDASGRMADPSVAVTSSGAPRISYHEWNLEKLLYAAKSGTNWQLEAVDQPAGVNVGRFSSLAVDPQTGIPQIGYFDFTNKELKYAAKDGQSWATEVADTTGDVGRFSRLTLDSTGAAHMSYYDATTYSFKYASMLIAAPPDTGSGGEVVSPRDFPYRVTIETRCAESIGRLCLRKEIVRTCVGGNCFDFPRKIPGGCVICDIGAGALGGLAAGAAGSLWLYRRRRPGQLP